MKRKQRKSLAIAALLSVLAFVQTPIVFGADNAAAAYKLFQAKRYKEAAQLFETCIAAHSSNPSLYYYAAICYQESGNMTKAKDCYKTVVNLAPNSTVGQYSQSMLARFNGTAGAAAAASSPGVSASIPASTGGDSPAGNITGPNESRIYYRNVGEAMHVTVEINGRPIDMVLDTGAPTICLGKNQLSTIGMRVDGAALGQTGGSSNSAVQNMYAMTASVKVGPFVLPNAPLKILENNQSEPLLGQDFLRYFDYTVDRGAHCILLVKKGSSGSIAKAGIPLPFEFREAGSRIILEGEINGKKGKFMMDTGNSADGIAFHSVEQAKNFGAPPPPDAQTAVHSGVSGSGAVLSYRIDRLRVGPIEKTNLSVSANLDGTAQDLPLLGHQFFDGWQYNVDLANKKLWLLHR